MQTSQDFTQDLCRVLILSAEKGVLRKAVFSKSKNKKIAKAVASPINLGFDLCLQIEYFQSDNKAIHKNIKLDDNALSALQQIAAEFAQINVLTEVGDCEYRESNKGKKILLGGDKLIKKLENTQAVSTVTATNNKKKNYILSGSEPFLIHLGVSDKNGRVYDKKRSKFRQINRFLELVRDVEDRLPEGKIRICDLCCGKSYLSFAVYHYFANIKNYQVKMTGIDLKPDVISHCSAIARELGFDGLEFVCGDINEYVTDEIPSLVISLHACDIATDIVLTKAAEWNTDVILSTPCCHHELNHSINCDALSFITDYSMLRQKLCDAATDALRLKRLESQGYSVAALELIDPDETPKNIMLRAVKKKNFNKYSRDAQKALEEYLAAKKFLLGENTDKYHF